MTNLRTQSSCFFSLFVVISPSAQYEQLMKWSVNSTERLVP